MEFKRKIFLLAAVIIIVAFFIICGAVVSIEKYVIINNKKIKVEIADTSQSIYNGLSNRDYLCEDCGMLFIFKDKSERIFVMREMKFNLDIIWIEDDNIVKIDNNLTAEGINPSKLYGSWKKVDKVLEVNANFCEKNNIRAGDKITL